MRVKIETPHLIAGGVAAVALLGGLGYWLMSESGSPTDQIAQDIQSGECKALETVTVSADDWTFGDASAPITLVEYASQTCSHCAEFSRDVWPKLKANYVTPGHVRFVFREFQRNRIDLAASVLGRCLGREAFIPFTEMLFENQMAWMAREDQDIVAGLREMSRRAGMSNEEFEACMKKEDEAKRLSDQRDKAMKDYCIDATPTLIMNGKKMAAEATTYEGLDAALRAELTKLGKTPPPATGASTEPPAAAPATEGAAPATLPADGAAPATPPASAPVTPPPDTPASSEPATGTPPAQ